jgi:hypothetical protein
MTYRSQIFVVTLALTVTTACERSTDQAPTGAPAPTAVVCTDAPQWRQRANDERQLIGEATSDQAKIVGGSRANFYVSLAVVADLKCKVTSADADALLTLALSAARNAEGASNFYETAIRWSEAGMAASQAVSKFVEQLPPSPE